MIHVPICHFTTASNPRHPTIHQTKEETLTANEEKKSHKSREHINLYFPHRLLKVIIISFDLMTIFIQSFIGAETSRAVQMNEVTKRKRKKK